MLDRHVLIFWYGAKQVVKDDDLVLLQTVTKRHCLRENCICTGSSWDLRTSVLW